MRSTVTCCRSSVMTEPSPPGHGVIPLVVLLAACGGTSASAEPTAPAVEVAPAAPALLVGPARATVEAPRPPRCPLIALELVSETPHGEVVMATLGKDGTVAGPPELSSRPLGTFDERGCIVDEEGVAVDWTLGEELWMMRTTLPADERRVGRFVIDDGGRLTADEKPGLVVMRLEGFRPEALCAGKLLVGVMHAMMAGVSMAVVDGVAETLEPPADSACADRHRRP